MNVEINYLAVLLAGASSMVVGSIWYSMGVFGRTWAKLAKVDLTQKTDNRQMTIMLTITFIASLVTAYVLAHVAFLSNHFFKHSFMYDSVMTSIWLWLGFSATRFLTHDLFEGRRKKLTVLNTANELTTVLVMAIIIGLLRP